MGVSAIWCDFAGVLTAPIRDTFAGFCARRGADPAVLLDAMAAVAAEQGCDDMMAPLDTPLMTAQQWRHAVERAAGERSGAAVDLSDFARDWFSGRPGNDALAGHLRRYRAAGCFVGMLSNMVPAFDPYWRDLVSPEDFDDIVFSYEVGVRKPDPAMYALCAQRAGAAPAECLLVDDLPENCAGARAAGWQAVHFTDTDAAVAEIENLVAEGATSCPG